MVHRQHSTRNYHNARHNVLFDYDQSGSASSLDQKNSKENTNTNEVLLQNNIVLDGERPNTHLHTEDMVDKKTLSKEKERY